MFFQVVENSYVLRTVTAEVASSSTLRASGQVVVPAIFFLKELSDVRPKTLTHNPTHSFCTLPDLNPTASRNFS